MELMVTVAVAAAIFGLGVPAFREFGKNGRLTGAANETLLTFMTARNEAVRRQLRTSVCPSATPDDALAICDEEARGGFIAFIDTNSNCQRDDDEEIVSTMVAHSEIKTGTNISLHRLCAERLSYSGGRPAGQCARRVLRQPRHAQVSDGIRSFYMRAASRSWPRAGLR